MKVGMNDLKREVKHLPPSARERAERELGLPATKTDHRVFVYGTLLAGERNARHALDARRVPAYARGTIYDTGWGFPAFVRKGKTRVMGELLLVDDEGFKSMDRLEGYPRLYRREQIQVNLVGGGRVLAWVYIMNRLPEGAKVIEGGDWKAYRRGAYPNR